MKVKGYSQHARSAAMDIANNHYAILKREKYKKIIARTVIDKFKNGLGKMIWLDDQNMIVAEHTGALDFDYYPLVGEVIYEEVNNLEEELISIREYAELHNVSPDTVRQKVLRGNLPAEKIGRNWCINRSTPYTDNRMKQL